MRATLQAGPGRSYRGPRAELLGAMGEVRPTVWERLTQGPKVVVGGDSL